MTSAELAKASNTTKEYIAGLCRDGRLDAVERDGTWFVERESAERWLRDWKGPGRPPKKEDG
jgi:hypothetical protein